MYRIFLSAFFITLISSNAYAGMGACHDGSGNITNLDLDGNHVFYSQTANCEYYSLPQTEQTKFDRIRTLIKTVPKRYIKWTTEPVEMTQAEKDAVDQAEAQAQLDADRARADKLEFTMEDVITALVKRINTRIPSNPITKQEIIDQLKSDKGL